MDLTILKWYYKVLRFFGKKTLRLKTLNNEKSSFLIAELLFLIERSLYNHAGCIQYVDEIVQGKRILPTAIIATEIFNGTPGYEKYDREYAISILEPLRDYSDYILLLLAYFQFEVPAMEEKPLKLSVEYIKCLKGDLISIIGKRNEYSGEAAATLGRYFLRWSVDYTSAAKWMMRGFELGYAHIIDDIFTLYNINPDAFDQDEVKNMFKYAINNIARHRKNDVKQLYISVSSALIMQTSGKFIGPELRSLENIKNIIETDAKFVIEDDGCLDNLINIASETYNNLEDELSISILNYLKSLKA